MEKEAAEPIRVLLIDDHKTMLWGLTELINSTAPRIAVVATAGARDDALEAARREQPDVILLDLDLGTDDGSELLPALLRESTARVLICTGVRDTEAHDRAMLRGARGVGQERLRLDPRDAGLLRGRGGGAGVPQRANLTGRRQKSPASPCVTRCNVRALKKARQSSGV